MKATQHELTPDLPKSPILKFFKKNISLEANPFQPDKMRRFLVSKGYSKDGVHYYVFVSKDQIGKNIKFFGVISLFEKEMFLSDVTNCWQVPYEAVKLCQTIESSLANEFSLKLEFETDAKIETRYISVPTLLGNVPSMEAVDKNKTQELFKLLEQKISQVRQV